MLRRKEMISVRQRLRLGGSDWPALLFTDDENGGKVFFPCMMDFCLSLISYTTRRQVMISHELFVVVSELLITCGCPNPV